MVRTQVQLTEEQIQTLRRLSAESGQSIAEIVRLGVQLYIGSRHRPSRAARIERAIRAAGRFTSGLKDVSARHDEYLAEAFRK